MKINRHNYETWFLDFAEGNLSVEDQNMVMDFLDLHADLKEEFELLDIQLRVMPSDLTLSKDLDMRKVLPANHADDELIIAYLSNDLAKIERKRVASRLEIDANFNKLYKEYKDLVLQPDESISSQTKLKVRGKIADHIEDYMIGFHEEDLTIVEQKLFDRFIESRPKIKQELKVFGSLRLHPYEDLVYNNKQSLRRSKPIIVQFYRWTAVAAAAAILLFFLLPGIEDDPGIVDPNDIALRISDIPVNNKQNLSIEDDELITENTVVVETPIKIASYQESDTENNPGLVDFVAKEDLIFKEKLIDDVQIKEIPVIEKITDPADIIQDHIALNNNNDPLEDETKIEEDIASNIENENRAKTFHILDVVEAAGDKSGLYSFTSNVKEESDYKEFSFGIGKFKISRKSKKKSRS